MRAAQASAGCLRPGMGTDRQLARGAPTSLAVRAGR
jgi:hypothetical protein